MDFVIVDADYVANFECFYQGDLVSDVVEFGLGF